MLTPYLEIGEVLKPQGVQGLVKVRPDTDAPERYLVLKSVFVEAEGGYRELPISDQSLRDGYVYLRLDGARTRDEAEKQRGLMLYVDRAHARPLGKDEWYITDLVGCRVSLDSGEMVGEVTEVMQPGANDVFVIRGPKGEILVPVLRDVLVSVDVEDRSIVLNARRFREVAVLP